jgi:hypothetical protein
MRIPAHLLRAVLALFAAGVWALTIAALEGQTAQTGAAALALTGAAIVASRGGAWIALGIGASLASGSVLTIGSASATVSLIVNVSGVLLVTAAGLRLALGLARNADAAVRPVLVGVVGFLVADYAVVHDTAAGHFSPLALVLPAAALLPMAYGAWSSLPLRSVVTAPRPELATQAVAR